MDKDSIFEWRSRQGWPQREAARQLGIGLRQYQRYELGQWPVPRYIALSCWSLEHGPKKLQERAA